MAASLPLSTSAIVVCFNEEDRIEDCLKSLAWCDEIVVVDSYSTDKTPEICRRYTEKFVQRQWAGYRDQKAYAHSLATMEWVLLVDSDERVSDELRREITEVLAGDKGEFAGYAIPRLVHYLGRWWRRGGWYPDYDVRLVSAQAGDVGEAPIRMKRSSSMARCADYNTRCIILPIEASMTISTGSIVSRPSPRPSLKRPAADGG